MRTYALSASRVRDENGTPIFIDVTVEDITNTDPVKANENFSVMELIRFIKQQSFPISYLPVVDDTNKVTGAVTFFNLIKGEL